MAIVWTKQWSASDDGTILRGVDLKNLQDDINATGLADADKIQGFPVDVATPADDGKALVYDDANAKYTHATASGFVPGLIFPYGGSSAPTGFLLCYGQAVSRTTYSALFAIIGTAYGVGDGSTTFNVPDLRGRFPLGADNMGGASANRVTASEADTIGQGSGNETKDVSHTHSVSITSGGPSATVLVDDASGGDDHLVGDETHTHTVSGTSGSGGSATQDVMNPYQTVNYIIKI